MEIESAQNFEDTPSAEGASSSKEMQKQDTDICVIQVRSVAIANNSSELGRGHLLKLLFCLLNFTFIQCSKNGLFLLVVT
jgi:hypothetical protein